MNEKLLEQIDRSIDAITSLRDDLGQIEAICERLIATLRAGGTIYTAGNGGSATHAFHLAEELIGRYRTDRIALRSICLNADPTALTCIANDFGFESVFSRQCEALLGSKDTLCVFSTSGGSPNLTRALLVARAKGAVSIGFLGRDGGDALPLCDLSLVSVGLDSASIQDTHQVALHLVCEAIENAFVAPTE